jgi:hypothetical protein
MRSLTIIILVLFATFSYAGENGQELATFYPSRNLKVDIDWDDIMEIVVKNESSDVIYKYIDDDKWEKLIRK